MDIYGAVVLGIIISVLLPLLRAFLPKPPKPLAAGLSWATIRPYIATALFAIITGILIVASVGEQLDTTAKALMAGYFWDSTLQKFTTGNVAAEG